MKNSKPICIICGCEDMKLHFYPPNRFNKKVFYYYKCNSCSSLSIFPLPTPEDFGLIYGTNDHFYLLNSPEDQLLEFNFNYKEFTNEKYQLDFLEKAIPIFKGRKILDYACGNGYYMAYAKKIGLQPIGIEYSKVFSRLLRKKTKLEIYSFDEFEAKYNNEKFDIIHFGHILEHLVTPFKCLNDMKKYAHKDTLYIIDGPLENNICLSRLILNIGSKLKRKKYNEYQPQHLSFTTYDAQLLFFKKLEMKIIKYKVVEQYWPLPQTIEWTSFSSIIKFSIARCSIMISKCFKKHGNIFHCIGMIEN